MCSQGEIFSAPFPYSDNSDIKYRPVLIISKNSLNKGDDVIVAKISSSKTAINSTFSFTLKNEHINFQLRKDPSAIRYTDILPMHKKLLKQKIGNMKNNFLKEVLEKIQSNFEIE